MIDQAATADAYRSRARRLRYRYRHDSAMKLFALTALSRGSDLASAIPSKATYRVAADPVRDFTTRISCELTGTPTLRYSRRLALLRRAQRVGIDRFDANLMIAAVQHRTPTTTSIRAARGSSLMLSFGIFAIVQSVIVAGAWLAFAG